MILRIIIDIHFSTMMKIIPRKKIHDQKDEKGQLGERPDAIDIDIIQKERVLMTEKTRL